MDIAKICSRESGYDQPSRQGLCRRHCCYCEGQTEDVGRAAKVHEDRGCESAAELLRCLCEWFGQSPDPRPTSDSKYPRNHLSHRSKAFRHGYKEISLFRSDSTFEG